MVLSAAVGMGFKWQHMELRRGPRGKLSQENADPAHLTGTHLGQLTRHAGSADRRRWELDVVS